MKQIIYKTYVYQDGHLFPFGMSDSFDGARSCGREGAQSIQGEAGFCVTEKTASAEYCLWTEGRLWPGDTVWSDANEIIDEWLEIARVYHESQKIDRFELMEIEE